MRRRAAILLLSLLLFAGNGGKRAIISIKTPKGNYIPLYKASYALLIGNGNYRYWKKLPGPTKDVDEVAAQLKKIGFSTEVHKDLTKEEFEKIFSKFVATKGQEKDAQILIYYAGHGHSEKDITGQYLGYLAMVDTPHPDMDKAGFYAKSIPIEWVARQAKIMKAKHVLFMFDSCFSGTVLKLTRAPRRYKTPITWLIANPVREFITAGAADETVPDRSYFKMVFLDVLQGKEPEIVKDGYLTGTELAAILANKVPYYYPYQHPQFGKIKDPALDKGDFVFVLKRGGFSYEAATPPPAPSVSDLDLTDLQGKVQARRSRWQAYLDKMKSAFEKVKQLDQEPALTLQEKREAWEKFLATFQQDDPFSSLDEHMREYAKERVKKLKERIVGRNKKAQLGKSLFRNISFPSKIKKLLEKGADPNVRNEEGLTPLHIAAQKGQGKVADLLLSYGADVNARDYDGWTPLHWAVFWGKTEVVKVLLSHGADVNAKTKRDYSTFVYETEIYPAGSTPLDIAKIEDNGKMVSLLRSHGGRCNTTCGK